MPLSDPSPFGRLAGEQLADAQAPDTPDIDDAIDHLLDAVERIADGLAGIADAINRQSDHRAADARAAVDANAARPAVLAVRERTQCAICGSHVFRNGGWTPDAP